MPRRSSPAPLPTSARACRALQSAALDLHLDNSHSGTKATRAARLWAHLQNEQATEDDTADGDTSEDTTEDPGSASEEEPSDGTEEASSEPASSGEAVESDGTRYFAFDVSPPRYATLGAGIIIAAPQVRLSQHHPSHTHGLAPGRPDESTDLTGTINRSNRSIAPTGTHGTTTPEAVLPPSHGTYGKR